MLKVMRKILLYFLLPVFGLAVLGAIVGSDEEVALEPADQQEQMAVDSQREVGQKPTSQPEPEPTTFVVADKEVERPPFAQALTPIACKEHPTFTLSYDAPVQVRRIAEDTVVKMGMKVGPLDALPANKKRSWYFSSSGPTALSVLSRGEDWTWFTHGGTVKFRKRDDIKGLVIYEVLDIKPRLEEGKLVLKLETDLPDEAEVTVEIYRSYEAKGEDGRSETYTHQYFRECGRSRGGRPKRRSERRGGVASGPQSAPGQNGPSGEGHGIRDCRDQRPHHRLGERRNIDCYWLIAPAVEG